MQFYSGISVTNRREATAASNVANDYESYIAWSAERALL